MYLFASFRSRIAGYSFHQSDFKTAVIFKDAKLSSLGRASGRQFWFPASVLLVTGSTQSQSSSSFFVPSFLTTSANTRKF